MPMNKAERLQYERDLEADMNAPDPRSLQPSNRSLEVPCPAAVGRNHWFRMRGSDGQTRCCYCCKTRAEVEAL